MKKQEKLLFKELCSFREEKINEKLLESATAAVLGQLFFNRMQAVAYGELERHGLLEKVNREFRNSLKGAHKQNIEKNQSFFKCVAYLSEILRCCECKYAMLKGAYLCGLYPEGYRTSNDIDLLVLPEDVTKIGNILLSAGFKQGSVKNGEFVEATRRQIIESKMLRGETVPYIKEMNLKEMKYLEVDINFSLDYKNGADTIIRDILNRTALKRVGETDICTLDKCDFFIHICTHLYKEATTLPWVKMKRDMTLYKYCDIYMLLSEMYEGDVSLVFNRAKALGVDRVCAFAVLQTAELLKLKNKYAIETAKSVLAEDMDFLHRVISPNENKVLEYSQKDIFERFFDTSREKLLKEAQL